MGISMYESEVDDFRSVRAPTIPAIVAERLRDAILAGKYSPGERLIEQKIAALFGIGQPTVREALRELELQGFVRKRPNRATHVTKLTRDDLQKSHEVRIVLEAFAVEKAAQNLTSTDVNELQGLIQKMEATVMDFDRAAFHKIDMAFHRKIWRCAGNEYLSGALERITFSVFAFQLLERKPGDPVMSHVVEEHREILAALQTGDGASARNIFTRVVGDFWLKFQNIHYKSVE